MIGDGATLNSTYSFLYGRLTVTLSGSPVAGAVTAAVLMGTKKSSEIDIELLGGDPSNWQTNVFKVNEGEEPLYGVLGGISTYSGRGTVDDEHEYVVDWNADRIVWSVDGKKVRTLTPRQTLKNGKLHYPDSISRMQLGVWDASNPAGTAEWAKGPINWAKQGSTPITALVKSVKVECPY